MVALSEITQNELLQFAIQNGILNIDTVREQIEMNERQKYLEKHPYKVWQDGDGRWSTYLPGENGKRERKKKRTKAEIEKLIIEYWQDEEENPTIDEVFAEWNDRRFDLGKISAATHTRNKQYYIRHYQQMGKRRIKKLQSEDIIDFLEEQIPKYNLTSKAFSNLKGITKGFLKRAKKLKLISWSIEEALYDLDVSDAEFKRNAKEDYEEVFDIDETAVMLDYLKENIDTKNLAIMLMFMTGMRIGEVVALKPEVLEKDFVKVRRTESRWIDNNGHYVYEVIEHPKTNAGCRSIVVPEAFSQYYAKIRLLNPFGEYVFCNNDGERYTTVAIRRRLERVCKNVKVYRKSPHKIRKTYGTMLMDSKVDERFIINQMGHTDILCSETHYHRDRKSVELKKSLLNQVPEFKCM